MTDAKDSDSHRGPARRADYKQEEARLKAASPRIPYSDEAELFALHGLPAPPSTRAKAAKHAAHRPVSGFTRTLDAACIFRYLKGRGLRGREATAAITAMLGTSRSSVLKYQLRKVKPALHPEYQTGVIEPSSAADDRQQAEYAIARHWDNLIRHEWWALTPKARGALLPVVGYQLLKTKPPDKPKTRTGT